jgi:nucleoside-diphosphate-sugar epimerase
LTCFVTGATGFIGTHLVRRLTEEGFQVRCLVRSRSPTQRLSDFNIDFCSADLLDVPKLAEAMRGCQFVFHLAGLTKATGRKRLLCVNEQGASTVAEACARQDVPPTLVAVSSLAAAGPALDGIPVTEQTELCPVSWYGKSKLAGELAIRRFARSIPATIVRPPIVLGEGDIDGLALFRGIARFGLHLVPTFGEHLFSIIHVDDLVSALITVARRGERLASGDESTGVYYVAAETTPSYAELGRMIGRAVGRRRVIVWRVGRPTVWTIAGLNELWSRVIRRPHILNSDKAREATTGAWICSPEKIQKKLGFRVKAPIEQRLHQTARWYASQGYFRLRTEPRALAAWESRERRAS